MNIRMCEPADVQAICDIYNYYVDHSIITFEELPVAVDEMAKRVEACTQRFPWLVCETGGRVVGYAYANRWHGRSAYRFSIEVTVYVRHGDGRKGYGQALYGELFRLLAGKCHVIVAGVSLPNEGSVRLHEKLGFRKVAHFSEVGRKFDRWVDVGYWQKVLDERCLD